MAISLQEGTSFQTVLAVISWIQTPSAQNWTALGIVLAWILVRFNRCACDWLLWGLKKILRIVVECCLVGWGLLVVGQLMFTHVQGLLSSIPVVTRPPGNFENLLILVIFAFTSGGFITYFGLCYKTRSNGSGAGKQSKIGKVPSIKNKKDTCVDDVTSTTVYATSHTPIDDITETFISRQLTSRINHLEELMQCMLSKMSDIPSIDLIAASFQDVHENIQSEGGSIRSTLVNSSPIVAPITTALKEGNPLLESEDEYPISKTPGSTHKSTTQEIQKSTPLSSSQELSTNSLSSQQKCPEEIMTESMLKEFIGLPKDDFLKKTAQLSREIRDARRKPNELTVEERELGQRSLRDLDLKWIKESFRQIKPCHYQEIGFLTSEEATFSRNSVKEIIRQRRHENWVTDMKKKGVTLFICPNCNTTTTDGHRCFATAWNTKIRKGPFQGAKEVLVTQQGRGAIKLQEQMRLDQEHLGKSYRKLHEKKHLLTTLENQAQALRQYLSTASDQPEKANDMQQDANMSELTAPNNCVKLADVQVTGLNDLENLPIGAAVLEGRRTEYRGKTPTVCFFQNPATPNPNDISYKASSTPLK